MQTKKKTKILHLKIYIERCKSIDIDLFIDE